MKRIFKIVTLMLLTSSCTNIVEMIDDNETHVIGLKKKELSLVFSHNVNGETHPCGCRHHPLGGLPQVFGLHSKIKKTNDLIYVDTGDTFFASSNIPKSMYSSLGFAANNLAKGLDEQGLKFFIPGDQDFAMGKEFLNNISKKYKFDFLISNLKDSKTFKNKDWALIEKGPHKIFITGVVDPSLITPPHDSLFTPISNSLKSIIEKIKKNGFEDNNPLHRLVLLSHSGMKTDKKIASLFPQIDWIIGAHSQSFTRDPEEEKNTKLVQVLSRNHYVGEIKFSMTGDNRKDSYAIHEIRDELAKEVKENKFYSFIDAHKKKLSDLQIKEQEAMSTPIDGGVKLQTAKSCMECHQDQTEHWKGSAHSLAYVTLVNAKEPNNMTCVKCHSVGLGSKHGFSRVTDMVIIDEEVLKEKNLSATDKAVRKLKAKYFKSLHESFKSIGSVRALSKVERAKQVDKWFKLDTEHSISHNFANVQCLNCHDKHLEHPFTTNEVELEPKVKKENMKKKCLTCHDPEQSPEWYTKKENGLPGDVNSEKLNKMIKEIGCPKE